MDSTWYYFSYHLGVYSKQVEPILEGGEKTLQSTGWSERLSATLSVMSVSGDGALADIS